MPGDDPAQTDEINNLLDSVERRALWYCTDGMGDGMAAEGDGYHLESIEYLFAMLHCAKSVRGLDFFTGTRLSQALPHYLKRTVLDTESKPQVFRWGRSGDQYIRSFPETLLPRLACSAHKQQDTIAQFWQSIINGSIPRRALCFLGHS